MAGRHRICPAKDQGFGIFNLGISPETGSGRAVVCKISNAQLAHYPVQGSGSVSGKTTTRALSRQVKETKLDRINIGPALWSQKLIRLA